MHVAVNAQLVSFAQSYRNAGVSRYTYRLVEGLARYGSDDQYTTFVSARESADSRFPEQRMRLVPAQWPTDRPAQRVLWEQVALPDLLRRLRVDVFHAPVNVLPARLPCASVVTIHDLGFLRYPHFLRPARRLYQRTFTTRSARAATRVIAISESTRQDVIALGVPPERVRVVYNSVEERFRPEPDPARLQAFRDQHGLPPRFVLYLGTLEPRKNLVGLLEGYARLRAQEPEAPPLVLAGAKGWYYDAIFERVRALGLERAVTFAGYIRDEEQPLWYAAAELFVYPSLFEGFGLPAVEAMACGVPVITSNVSSLPEVVGDAAMQVEPHDYAALAHAMRSVLRDDEARHRLIARGLNRARWFSAERMIQGCRDTYAEAFAVAGRRHVVEVG